jgi:hypothetical protein
LQFRLRSSPRTARRRSYGCIGRDAPQQPPRRTTLLWRRRSSGSSPRVRRRWHDTRPEDNEQQPQSVPAVRGRSPRNRGFRAVGLVGGAQLDVRRNGLWMHRGWRSALRDPRALRLLPMPRKVSALTRRGFNRPLEPPRSLAAPDSHHPDAGAAELLPSSPATTRPDPSVGFPELH